MLPATSEFLSSVTSQKGLRMGIKAFVLYNFEPTLFFERFLQSPDFTVDELRQMTKDWDVTGSKSTRNDVVNTIMTSLGETTLDTLAPRVMPYLLKRPKEWLSLRVGEVKRTPDQGAPATLATSRGEEEWYGPLCRQDDTASARWYIRPCFFEHWENDANGQPRRSEIRWLCFARVEPQNISLHWRGFSYSESEQTVDKNTQFPYWQHIPGLFDEIIDINQWC